MQGARRWCRWCCRTPGSEPHDFALAHEEIRHLCEAIWLTAARLFIQPSPVASGRVSWTSESCCTASRRAQSDGGRSKKCKSYSRIDLLGVRKPMEPTLAVCRVAVECLLTALS